MKKWFCSLMALFVMALPVLACSSTFQVVKTPFPPPVSVTEQPQNGTSLLLPRTFYYLANGQVFRMERDGKTVKQLTFEPVPVTDYDVSLRDGSIAYVTDNQLTLVSADNSSHIVIAGGRTPVFSPDGRTLAYSMNGLNLYDIAANVSNVVYADQPLGGSLPPAIYVPDQFSPDGTKLLVKIGHPPDSPWTEAIYSFADNSLLPFAGASESITCCVQYGGAHWSADSTSFYAVASVPDSSFPFGELWKVDAATGTVTTLATGGAGEGDTRIIYLPYKPYPAPDGQIYFFFAKFPESAGYFRRAPLILIRSTPSDITTNWTVLRGDTFELMNEALWSPDANFVIVAFAPNEDVYEGGRAEIVYLDGRPNLVLTPSAQQMKWGP